MYKSAGRYINQSLRITVGGEPAKAATNKKSPRGSSGEGKGQTGSKIPGKNLRKLQGMIGRAVTGTIVGVKEYGAFVKLEGGLVGLIHISELPKNRLQKRWKLGDAIEPVLLGIQTEPELRISLSLRKTSTLVQKT